MALYDLVPSIQVQVANCPENLIKMQLRNALRTFEKECDCLVETKETTLTGSVTYIEVVPTESTTHSTNHILAVDMDGIKFDPGFYVFNPVNNRLEFSRAIGMSGNKITVSFTKVCNSNQTECPDFIITRYGEALINRALFTLFSIPGKPWSSADAAQFALKNYEIELSHAIADIESGNKPYDSQMKYTFVHSGGIW